MQVIESAEAARIGRREEMQDAVLRMDVGDGHVFGVFDGHGKIGAEIAALAAASVEAAANKLDTRQSALEWAGSIALDLARLDESLQEREHIAVSGSTATIAVVQADRLATVQLGDSAVIFCPSRGEPRYLTAAHDIYNQEEIDRVAALGIEVELVGLQSGKTGKYFGGVLAVSRAIGDASYRRRFVVAEAEVQSHEVNEPGTLLVTTDGLLLGGGPRGRARAARDLTTYDLSSGALDEWAESLTGNANDNIGLILARCEV